MSTDLLILGATAVLALVATIAAVVTVRAARRVASAARSAEPVASPDQHSRGPKAPAEPPVLTLVPIDRDGREIVPSDGAAQTRVVDGRVVVVPTPQQLVATALSRPSTRLDILAHGLAHALRPESRDRITGMMRREFRQRRRARSRAARRAARRPLPAPGAVQPAEQWLGDERREASS